MGVWKDIILILSILGVFVFGFFLMTQLDKFLDENRKAIEKEEEKKEPSCVMLTGEMPDEEFVREGRRFCATHEGARIILYDSSEMELPEKVKYPADHKR